MMAPGSRKKQPLKRAPEHQHHPNSDNDDSTEEVHGRVWPPIEKRSKQRNNMWPVQSQAKDKGKAAGSSPPPKKHRMGGSQQRANEEDLFVNENYSNESDHK